jgi:ligand-binding sensor domain-containing protein
MKCFLTVCFLLLAGLVCSQSFSYVHYNTDNSKLPHDAVYELRQDKSGFIWICTDDGLIRFDGTEMVAYEKGFKSRYAISTDEEDGRIWVSTWKGGIHYLRNDTAVPVKAVPGRGVPLHVAEEINAYTFNTNGIIAFNDLLIARCFQTYMLLRFDSLTCRLVPHRLEDRQDGRQIARAGDKDYFSFIKTASHRLYAYSKRGVFEVVEGKLKPLSAIIKPDNLCESPSGMLYFREGDSVYSTNSEFSTRSLVYRIPLKKFRNMVAISFNVIASDYIGMLFETPGFPNSARSYFLIDMRDNSITDLSKVLGITVLSAQMMMDQEGGIWLSTDGNGLYHLFGQKFKGVDSYRFHYNSTITSLVSFPGDSLLIGTKEGLYLYRHKVISAIKCHDTILNYPISSIFKTPAGHVGFSVSTVKSRSWDMYVIMNRRIKLSSDTRTLVFKHYVFTSDKDGNITLKDREGLKDYSSEIGQISQILINGVEDGGGGIWLHGASVLYYFHPNLGLRLYHRAELSDLQLNCLSYVAGKGLYIGTNQGLFLVTPARMNFRSGGDSGSLQHWAVEDGLTNLNVRCLLSESPGSLWIGTQNGLFHFNGSEFSIYKKRDGLIADDVTHLASMEGNRLAVGSSKGLTVFTAKPTVKSETRSLYIEKLMVNDKTYDWHKTIDAPYNSTVFLKYGLVTFVYPGLLVYSYRLNRNEKWITTQNNSLVFTNLKPGDYSLELKVKKYNAHYSAPVLIRFRIGSPWWKTLPFYSLMFALFIILAFVYIRVQLNKQKAKALARYELAELKMKALQAQLNPHFISNALNAIQYFILRQDEKQANHYLGEFADLTRLFLEISRKGLVPVQMELELLRNYLSFEKLRFGDKFDFSIEVLPSIDPSKEYIPGLLIQPFVENAVNHGIVYLPKERMGSISVKVEKEGEYVSITINDNGIGRKKGREIKNKLARFSRSHSTQIVEEIKQAYNLLPGCEVRIEVVDKGEETYQALGTCVYINIKISKDLINNQQF